MTGWCDRGEKACTFPRKHTHLQAPSPLANLVSPGLTRGPAFSCFVRKLGHWGHGAGICGLGGACREQAGPRVKPGVTVVLRVCVGVLLAGLGGLAVFGARCPLALRQIAMLKAAAHGE